MVAIALIAIMATVVIPNLRPRKPAAERKEFIGKLNALMRVAWYNTLITTKSHRLFFDMGKNIVRLEHETDKKDETGQPAYAAAKNGYMATTIPWPKHLEIKNFYIEGFDEMSRSQDRARATIWFFIVPSGVAQNVIINFLDTQDKVAGKSQQFGLVLNPFTAQFKEYDTFQK